MFQCKLLIETAKVPMRASSLDAGMDLCAAEEKIIPAGEQRMVNIGISLNIPHDCYARVSPRSGLALKHSIHVMAGVVDSGYRGSIQVILYNLGKSDFQVNIGDRIAQIIFEKIYMPESLEIVDELSETDRGFGGFGSSGI